MGYLDLVPTDRPAFLEACQQPLAFLDFRHPLARRDRARVAGEWEICGVLAIVDRHFGDSSALLFAIYPGPQQQVGSLPIECARPARPQTRHEPQRRVIYLPEDERPMP